MKKTITLSMTDKKLMAVEMYLSQKDTTLSAEIDKYVEQIYTKNVPQNVREFIDMLPESRPEKKPQQMRKNSSGDSIEQ